MGKFQIWAFWRDLCGAVLFWGLTSACSDDTFESERPDAPAPQDTSSVENPGAALDVTAPVLELAEPTWFYRLDLAKSASGELSLTSITTLELSVQPLPSLSAEYVVIAYSGGSVVSAVPLAFPTLALGSAASGAGHESLALAEAASAVFLEAAPGVDRIAVVDPTDTPVLEVDADALPPRQAHKRRAPEPAVGTASEPLSAEQLAFRYAHIRFLGLGDDPMLPSDPAGLETGTIVAPTDAMNDVIASGIAKVAPALLSSAQSIAVIRWPAGSKFSTGYVAWTSGGRIFLNVDFMQDPRMVPEIVHEFAHTFTHLINAAATNSTDLSTWSHATQNAVTPIIDRFRLIRGLTAAWADLQDAGVQAGYASPYDPTETVWRAMSGADANLGGFATGYGSTSPVEDIAEYVKTLQAPLAPGMGICPRFGGVSEVTSDVAIPYAKLIILRGIGAITDAAFNGCVQNCVLTQTSGIVFDGSISFTSNLQAGRLTQEGGSPSYGVLGDGPNTYRCLVEVTLPEAGASPLGLHRLDSIWLGNIRGDGVSGAYVGNDNTFLARAAERGFVFFTEASSTRTSGALFGVVFHNAAGLDTDYVPFGTFRVP